MDIRVLNRAKAEQWNLVASNYVITREINDIPYIEFNVMKDYEEHYKGLETEGYIVSSDGRFVIKEIIQNESEVSVYAIYDVEVLSLGAHRQGVTRSAQLKGQVEGLLPGTWTVEHHIPAGIEKQYKTIEFSNYDETNGTRWDDFLTVIDLFGAEYLIDNVNLKVDVYEAMHCGQDIGAYILDGFNLSSYSIEESTEDLVTILIPYGKDGLTIESVEPTGLDRIYDRTYVNKNIEATWTDERYTDAQSLYNAALKLLSAKSKPVISYTLTIADFNLIADNDTFDIGLGDTVRLSLNGVESYQTVVKIVENEDNPLETSISLSSAQSTLTDRIISLEKKTVTGSSGGGSTGPVAWGDISGKPSTFTPSAHTHTKSEVTDFPTFKTINGNSIEGSGDITISGGSGSLAACSARGSAGATSTTAGTITQVTLNTFNVNTDSSCFEFSNGKVKCKKAGTILVSGSIYEGYNGTHNSGVYIKQNGTEISSFYGIANNISTKDCAPRIVSVSAGDLIELDARTSVAGSYTPSNAGTHLDIVYLTQA